MSCCESGDSSAQWASRIDPFAVEPTETSVLHAMDENVDLAPYVTAARSAIAKGADVLILECTGMVSVRERLAEMLNTPGYRTGPDHLSVGSALLSASRGNRPPPQGEPNQVKPGGLRCVGTHQRGGNAAEVLVTTSQPGA